MNVLGKILVFLNLLFALAVGGFLLIDFQTRINWKKQYDDLKREFEVAKRNTDAIRETVKQVEGKRVEAEQAKTQVLNDFAVAKIKFKDDIEKYTTKVLNEAELQKLIALQVNQKQKQLEKYELENKTLVALLDKRDKQVLILEQEKDKYFKDAQQAINESTVAQLRMQQMQGDLKKLTLEIAGYQVTAKVDYGSNKGVKLKDKNSPNPPPFYIKGKIEKVDADDSTLVLISLGSDQGIAVGQTLDAFRKNPQAKYLGMVRIEEVTAHKAVGRLILSQYAQSVPLKVDDEVASTILPGY